MSKEQSPAFQYYPRDILSDINYQAMTWAERGMYHHLMDICWMETFIPDDPAILARVLGITQEEFSEAWKVIGRCFKGAPYGYHLSDDRVAGSVDHIVPVSKGGTNAIDNLRWMCRHCNCSAGNRG